MGIQRICKHQGCVRFRLEGSDFCSKHQADQEELDRRREERKMEFYKNLPRTTSEFYHTSMWRQERKKFLEEHPYCESCGEKSTEIHHDWPDKTYLTDEYMFYDKSHWVPLCHDCHTKISNRRANRRSTSLNVFTGFEQ